MQREIRFRVWTGKEMIVVDEIHPISFEEKGRWFLFDQGNNFVSNYITGHLMQYTGLMDKMGKRIYEGDIVKHKEVIFQIIWSEEDASFLLSKGPIENQDVMAWLGECAENSLIIGNIYENPELLK